ncbi:MAG: hypothetical protein QM783_09875 [Phycisphaerales bacterium]
MNDSRYRETAPTSGVDSRVVVPAEETTSRIMEIKNAVGWPLDRPVPMSPSEIHAVDDLQDDLMAKRSPEGRPPRHDLRIAEWRWLALAIGIVLAGGLVWAIVSGMAPVWIVIGALFMVCFIGVGSAPVLYAGLLRAREEHEARTTATAVVKDKAALRPARPS